MYSFGNTTTCVISFMAWWFYACVHWLEESARSPGLQPLRTPRRRQILHAFAGIRTQISRRPSSSPVTTPTALTGISIVTVLTEDVEFTRNNRQSVLAILC
jgi:hypothetical protein